MGLNLNFIFILLLTHLKHYKSEILKFNRMLSTFVIQPQRGGMSVKAK